MTYSEELRDVRDQIDRACRVGNMLAATLAVRLPTGHEISEEHAGLRLAEIEEEAAEVRKLRARERNLMAVDTEEAEIIAAAEKSECSDIIRERSELIDERNALLVKVGEARAEGTAQGRRGLAREFLSDMAIGWPEMLRKLREAAK
jgi:small-conductance mechanosensitive channel